MNDAQAGDSGGHSIGDKEAMAAVSRAVVGGIGQAQNMMALSCSRRIASSRAKPASSST